MKPRFALVLDRDADDHPDHWRALMVASKEAEIRLQHDGHTIILPRKAGDRLLSPVIAVNQRTGKEDPAHIVELEPD